MKLQPAAAARVQRVRAEARYTVVQPYKLGISVLGVPNSAADLW